MEIYTNILFLDCSLQRFFELPRSLNECKHLEVHPKNIAQLKTGQTLLGIPMPLEAETNNGKKIYKRKVGDCKFLGNECKDQYLQR